MSSPIFNRLSSASTDLFQSKEASIDDFAEKAANVASAVESFFHPEPSTEGAEETPSLIGRAAQWVEGLFGSTPTARAVGAREVDAQPLYIETSGAKSIVSEAKIVIIGKLLKYSERGEGQKVPLDRVSQGSVLRYLKDMIDQAPVDIFSRSLNKFMKNLEDVNEENNTIDWKKVLGIVRSLQRIGSS